MPRSSGPQPSTLLCPLPQAESAKQAVRGGWVERWQGSDPPDRFIPLLLQWWLGKVQGPPRSTVPPNGRGRVWLEEMGE